jgi:hypothetical protein
MTTKGHHVHRREFIKLVEELIAPLINIAKNQVSIANFYLRKHFKGAAIKTPCSPVSQISSTFLLVTKSNKDHGLQRELLTTGQQNMPTAVVVDSQVVKCNRFSHQQVIHILRSLQAPERYLTL